MRPSTSCRRQQAEDDNKKRNTHEWASFSGAVAPLAAAEGSSSPSGHPCEQRVHEAVRFSDEADHGPRGDRQRHRHADRVLHATPEGELGTEMLFQHYSCRWTCQRCKTPICILNLASNFRDMRRFVLAPSRTQENTPSKKFILLLTTHSGFATPCL